MDLLNDYIPYKCLTIRLDKKELIPLDLHNGYIILFISIEKENIKIYCKKSYDAISQIEREITFEWRCITNIKLLFKENRVTLELNKALCDFNIVELFVTEKVLQELKSTLTKIYIRLKAEQFQNNEIDARKSIRTFSTVEDSDFGTDFPSSSINSPTIIPNSYLSENVSKYIQNSVEDTPPKSPEETQIDIIPCTPANCVTQVTASPFIVQNTEDDILDEQNESNTSFCDEEFGRLVVPETDIESSSDSEESESVEADDVCLKIIPQYAKNTLVYYDDFTNTKISPNVGIFTKNQSANREIVSETDLITIQPIEETHSGSIKETANSSNDVLKEMRQNEQQSAEENLNVKVPKNKRPKTYKKLKLPTQRKTQIEDQVQDSEIEIIEENTKQPSETIVISETTFPLEANDEKIQKEIQLELDEILSSESMMEQIIWSQTLINDENNNDTSSQNMEEVMSSTDASTTPSTLKPKNNYNLRKIKTKTKRYVDSDSDEWTPNGIVKFKKNKTAAAKLERINNENSYFAEVPPVRNYLLKTRTRIVSRENRLIDELVDPNLIVTQRQKKVLNRKKNHCVNTEITAKKRQKQPKKKTLKRKAMKKTVIEENISPSSSSSSPNRNEDELISEQVPQNEESVEENNNTHDSIDDSFRPNEVSVIVKNHTQSTSSSSSPEDGIAITSTSLRRRRLSQTPKSALQHYSDTPKCSLPFKLVANEKEFNETFHSQLSQCSSDFNHNETSQKSHDDEAQTIIDVDEPSANFLTPPNDDIPATDPSRKLYKPFPIFTSESSGCNYSSPEISQQKIDNQCLKRKFDAFGQQKIIPEEKSKRTKVSFEMVEKENEAKKKRHIEQTKVIKACLGNSRSVLKPIENQLPAVILSERKSPDIAAALKDDINELDVQPYLFQNVSSSEDTENDYARIAENCKSLTDKVKSVVVEKCTEKNFFLLGIEVFQMCLKTKHKLTDEKDVLLRNFTYVFKDFIKNSKRLD